MKKSLIRSQILQRRKKFFFDNYEIKKIFKFLDKYKKNNIGAYYPINFEFNCLEILNELFKNQTKISLPIMRRNYKMDFYQWSIDQPLIINRFGIPEPSSKIRKYPDILIVPLVAFDDNLNRLGYGGGYYDRYINKIKKRKKITTVGLAFSFQQIKKIPVNKFDQKLDYIITERKIFK